MAEKPQEINDIALAIKKLPVRISADKDRKRFSGAQGKRGARIANQIPDEILNNVELNHAIDQNKSAPGYEAGISPGRCPDRSLVL